MNQENIYYLESHDELLNDPSLVSLMRTRIEAGGIYIIKNVAEKDFIVQIKLYLTNIGRNSLPNYKKIEEGCLNFHRINLWDKRSYVQACFHQFVFFPWNQDVFNFFEVFKKVYQVRNLISGNQKNKFLGIEPEDNCIARIAFQFYPKGIGGMHKHSDPIDHHQLTAPILQMSKKGVDFKNGGVFVETKDGKKILLEDFADVGDVVYFNAMLPHGVDTIDPECKPNWLSFEGRWTLLFAINKLFDNAQIRDAVDLEMDTLYKVV